MRVLRGSIYDVAVDLRRSSSTFGKWVGYELNDSSHQLLWVPPGFAHGFVALSERADVAYKATDFYAAEFERCVIWNDPDLAIKWPLQREPILSSKDARGLRLRDAELFS